MNSSILLLLLISFSSSGSTHNISYVIPSGFPLAHCPGEPCLTLDAYVQSTESYFVAGAVFEFIAGNHSLSLPMSITGIFNLTFIGDLNGTSRINIKGTNVIVQGTSMKLRRLSILKLMDGSDPVFMFQSSNVTIIQCNFGEFPIPSGPTMLRASNSIIKIIYSFFTLCFGDIGGVIYSEKSNVSVYASKFYKNSVISGGGVIYGEKSNIVLNGTGFKSNAAPYGGVIYCVECTMSILGRVEFVENHAKVYGGVFYVSGSTIVMPGSVLFYNNSAGECGGASSFCSTNIQCNSCNFIGNSAPIGAALFISDCDGDSSPKAVTISGNFINNTAQDCGSAAHITRNAGFINFIDTSFVGNQGSAVCLYSAQNITFEGTTNFRNNTSQKQGGGLYLDRSFVTFSGLNILYSNHAPFGGAIYSIYGQLWFRGNSSFAMNQAAFDGGVLYATGTKTTLSNSVQCIDNSAANGGVMYFEQTATVTFDTGLRIQTFRNYAQNKGGVIFHKDTGTYSQCIHQQDSYAFSNLFYCFIRLKSRDLEQNSIKFYSYNDSSGKDGAVIYGGMLDRCQINVNGELFALAPYEWIRRYILRVLEMVNGTVEWHRVEQVQLDSKKFVTSQAYQLCMCGNETDYNCSIGKDISVFKGQKTSISLLALDQTTSLVPTMVKLLKSSNARVQANQNPQPLHQNCSQLTYNVYSNNSQEQLTLYPDGPCRNLGLSGVVVHITFLPCPNGFTEFADHCVCEERLQKYADCFIDDFVHIVKKPGVRLWLQAVHDSNGTYTGLALYEKCPAEYCAHQDDIRVIFDNTDSQCSPNRIGLLCGACTSNHSLMLGSTRCEVCSNWYLFMLPAFFAAGIFLVSFLLLSRLTIVTGFLNSIIFYANIIQVNRTIFFTTGSRNILTVFIAWMNLDLGLEVCFYHGMDAYAQTWLQFAFPVYVWILVALITLTSQYSITVSRLIGHNPIAVLATLILMSYTKILRIIIEVLSSVELEYPHDQIVVVWLKDANVPYLKTKHLILTVVTVVVLVLLIVPYTLFLLVGFKLYRFTEGKYGYIVLSFIKPLLDSYYAPFKPKTRYWTGFLLLIRCALYIVFSYYSLSGSTKSLLAINLTFTSLLVVNWLSVYRRMAVTIVECFVFLNLVILSGLFLAGLNTPTAVNCLVGTVFVTMIIIILYHLHTTYTENSKLAIWVASMAERAKTLVKKKRGPVEPNDDQALVLPREPQGPSESVIDLREPLLENNPDQI